MLPKLDLPVSLDEYVYIHRCVFGPLAAVGCLFFIPLYKFWQRRFLYPLSARKPGICVCTSVAVLMHTVGTCVSWSLPTLVPNIAFQLVNTFYLIGITCYLWRVWSLYFLCKLYEETAALAGETNVAVLNERIQFFQKNRHLISSRILIATNAFIVTAYVAFLVVLSFRDERFVWAPIVYNRDLKDTTLMKNIFSVFTFFAMFAFTFMAVKIRFVGKDAFGIRNEFICCGITIILGFFGFFFIDIVITPKIKIGFASCAMLMAQYSTIFFSVVIPLRKSYGKFTPHPASLLHQ